MREDLFLSKVSPEPESGCWLWMAAADQRGYGLFGTGGSGNNTRAHRWSYRNFVGEIPEGKLVCHKCDTPSCVNPQHLFVGTTEDNNLDRDLKHRQARGLCNGKAKLNPELVALIRRSPLSERALARELGFHRGTVNAVRSGRTWGRV